MATVAEEEERVAVQVQPALLLAALLEAPVVRRRIAPPEVQAERRTIRATLGRMDRVAAVLVTKAELLRL